MKMFRRIFIGSSMGIIQMAIATIVTMVLMPFIIHSIGDYQYGLWIFVASFVGYYNFLDFGLSVASSKYIAEAQGTNDYNEMNIVLNSSTAFFTALGILIFGISVIGAILTPLFTTSNILMIQTIWLTIGVTSIFQFGLRGFYSVLYAKVRHDLMSYTALVKLFVRTGLIVYFLSQGYGVVALALITMITEILSYCVDMVLVKIVFPQMRLSLSLVKKDRIIKLFKYGTFSVLNQLSDLFRTKIIPLIATILFGVTYVVFFSIALRLAETFNEMIHKIVGILTPVFSQMQGSNNERGIVDVFWTSFRVNIVISSMIGFGLIFAGKPFVLWWIGPDYILAGDLAMWFGASFLLITLQEAGRSLVYGLSAHQMFATMSVVESFFGALVGVVFGSTFGPLGIAIGFFGVVLLFEIIVKPSIISQSANLSLSEYYKVLFEVLLKASLPFVYYGLLMYPRTEPDITSILINVSGFITLTPLILWFSLDQFGRNILSTKISNRVQFKWLTN